MDRVTENGIEYIIGYHTQEFRQTSQPLSSPIRCNDRRAWLGYGYYFWTEIEFAEYWGEDFKKRATGFYDIYQASLNCENCINAVFDEEGYFFFRETIEDAIDHFTNNGLTVSLQQVHRFLAENVWQPNNIDGVIYDDKPTNPSRSDRVYSEIPDLYYKKRIQIVLFSLKNINKFELLLEEQS